MIIKLWKELRLQNQLLIIQTLFVSVIFVILISAFLYLVKLFSSFIQQQLLQQLVLYSVVSSIQTYILRVDMIGVVVYNQFQASRNSLKLLFEFQVENNISAYSLKDDCLKSNHSSQFYSYQFCYELYGEEQNQSDFTQIHNFTALQNQFIPFLQQKLVPTYYNIIYGKTLYLSQYQGQFLPQIDKQLLDALEQMEKFQLTDYFQQQKNYTGWIFLKISPLDNQMYMGAILNQSENPYIQLIQSDQYFNQRFIGVLESGYLIWDSNDLGVFGGQFQNTSLTGFNDEQFQKIKNFANQKIIEDECKFHYKIQILIQIKGNNQYLQIVVETTFLNQTQKDFNQKLEQLIDDMFQKLGIQLMIAFIICIMLQIAFIKKLKRPLQELQHAAKSHIGDYQHTFQKIASVKTTQNQTQKLADAFFNLINLNNNSKTKQKQQFYQKTYQEYQQSPGTIIRRQSQKIIIQIRRLKQKRFWYLDLIK